MASMCKSIDVSVPVSTAYNQWTQFESFPQFMEGVESVVQKGDTTLHWKARIGGRETEWDARITEQIPDVRIAWRSTSGQPNSGAVDFHRIDDGTTRVVLLMETEPQGVVETVGDALGVLGRRIEKDLERFKEFIEKRGSETGAWRGEVPAAHNR
ncbi:MAG TPA: SRPBCC family protein [Candidatus Dormibacteraeota bacterium]|jgi:uncharacterized membrane protein